MKDAEEQTKRENHAKNVEERIKKMEADSKMKQFDTQREMKKLETAAAQLKIRQEEETKRVQAIQITKQVEAVEETKVMQAQVQLIACREKILVTFQQVLNNVNETFSEEEKPKISDLLMRALNIDMPERRRDCSNHSSNDHFRQEECA